MLLIARTAGAQQMIGVVTLVTGHVTVLRPPFTNAPLRPKDTFAIGDLITAGEQSAAEFFTLGGASLVKVRERTTLSVIDQTPGRTILSLTTGAVALAGAIAWQADYRDTFEIRTRDATAQSRGAGLRVEVREPSGTRVCVFAGTAVVSAVGGADDRRVPVGPRQCVAVATSDVGPVEPLPEPAAL